MAGYPKLNSLRGVRAAFRRCRNPQPFIIAADAAWNPLCACCGRPVKDFSGIDDQGGEMHPSGYRNNRCTYYPKTKAVVAMHYVCAWGKRLQQVAEIRSGA